MFWKRTVSTFYIASFSIYTLKLWKISTSKRPFPIWLYFKWTEMELRWYFISNFVHWNRKFFQSKRNFKNIYQYLPTFTFIRFFALFLYIRVVNHCALLWRKKLMAGILHPKYLEQNFPKIIWQKTSPNICGRKNPTNKWWIALYY